MKCLNGKKRNMHILKIDSRGVSTILGSMLLVSIVTSSMSVLISATSECNRQAILKESETRQDHINLIQEMQDFYNLVKNTNTSYIDNTSIEPTWYWPENRSTDIPLEPECKVYFNGPKSSVATVWFRYYGTNNNYLVETSEPKYRTVEGGSLVTFKYDEAASKNTTYYWKLEIWTPGKIIPTVLTLSFTTGSSKN